jgi:hypothetical protein
MTAKNTEHEKLVRDILVTFGSGHGLRIWKNNTGAVKIDDRFLSFGLKGSADILGIIGGQGKFLAIEVKTGRGRQTKEQKAFQKMIETHGGLYILARSVEDVKKALAVN